MAGREQSGELFAEYVTAHRAGEVDPAPFLDRAAPDEREVLVTLIDAYLVGSPGRKWDPESFKGSRAQAMVEPATRALSGVSGAWPVLLPTLRHRAAIKRAILVERLAAGLGFPKKSGRVGDYYHAMEQGSLPSAGVSNKVLEVLGSLLGSSAESLRESGQILGGGGPRAEQQVFARRPGFASETSADSVDSLKAAGQRSPAAPDPEEHEIDRLFTDG